jgi:cupin fold WbuC family metalloprotein
MDMQVIDSSLLDALSEKARQSPRLRMNHNLHGTYRDPCQRLLNAVEPGSYVRPHRHSDPPRPESFLVLRGLVALLVFTHEGGPQQFLLLGPGGPIFGADVAPGLWHSLLSLETGAVFFETKPGPYDPYTGKDWAPWSQAEESPQAVTYLTAPEGQVRAALRARGQRA